jgi:hypothetical protein
MREKKTNWLAEVHNVSADIDIGKDELWGLVDDLNHIGLSLLANKLARIATSLHHSRARLEKMTADKVIEDVRQAEQSSTNTFKGVLAGMMLAQRQKKVKKKK